MRDKFSKGWEYAKGVGAGLKLRGQWNAKGVHLTPIEQAVKTVDISQYERIIVEVTSTATKEIPKSALISIKIEDQNGGELDFGWPTRSNKIGTYRYLKPAGPSEKATTQFVIDPPEHAATLKLEGKTWNRYVQTMVEGEIAVLVMANGAPNHRPLNFSASHLKISETIPSSAARAVIELHHTADQVDSSGPVTVKFHDHNETELLGAVDLAQHPQHGSYFVLNGKLGRETKTDIQLDIPPEAKSLTLEGLDWGPKTALLLEAPTISFEADPRSEIRDFLEAIPPEDQLYVIDTTAPPLGHETLSLRPNNLTLQYEKLGIWVIFLPFGSLQAYPAHPSEKVMQVPRKNFQLLIELLRECRKAQNSVYICSSFPNFQSVTAGTLLKASGWGMVYECRDDMEEFNRVGYSKWYSQELERYLLDVADKVITVSPALLEKLEEMTPREFVGQVIPNGVANQTLESGSHLRTPAILERRNKSRIVGYVGHLTSSWFDWQAVLHAAFELPDVQFQIVGHGIPAGLLLPSNVEYLGPKTHEELLQIVLDWKVGLIPFQDIPLTRSVDPNKIYEYFAWGLRCVTSKMGSVHEYPSTWVYSGRESLTDAVQQAVSSPFLKSELDTIDRFVSDCSWFSRAETMKKFIENHGQETWLKEEHTCGK